MNMLYIIVSVLLVATGANIVETKSKPENPPEVNSKSTPTDSNDPYGYYDTDPADINNMQKDKTSEDSSIRPSFITQPQTINAKPGDQVNLDCVTENAESFLISWKKNGEQIALSTSFDRTLYDFLPNNTLVIKWAKPQSSGRYSCFILIGSDDHPNITHRLKIQNAVEVTSLSTEDSKTKFNSGDNFAITCRVNGNPTPVIKWYFKGNDQERFFPIQSNDVLQKDTDTLSFTSANIQNSGTYRCEATNGESIDDQSIHIDVLNTSAISTGLESHTDTSTISTGHKSHTDSRVGGGSEHLVPSIAILIVVFALINQ